MFKGVKISDSKALRRAVKFIAFIMVVMTVFVCMPKEDVYARDEEGNLVIIIDPGHGGYDSGALSTLGDKECDLNWNIAKYMKAELETYTGVKIYVTRASNEWNTNTGRAQFGQKLGADVIISIHNNSSANADTSGYVVYGSVVDGYVEVTKNLALNLSRHAQGAGMNLYAGGYLTREATLNPEEDYYTVINEGIRLGIPTVIIEHCFLSNQFNAAYIHDANNQKKLGVANATAVAEFYGLSKRVITDGQNFSIERADSAYFIPTVRKDGAITFTTSDANIASVRSDGLITAISGGEATITYTYEDGTTGSCIITVFGTRQIGVAAGINPMVYWDSESVAAIDKSKIIIKAIFSDGSCFQVDSGYTIGDIDPGIAGRQYISVTHNGFSNTFSIVLDPTMDKGTYSDYLYQINGSRQDIFMIPEIISAGTPTGTPYLNPGFVTNIIPGVSSTERVTEPAPTEPETTQPETTQPETTTETEPVTEPETTTEAETTTEEISTEETSPIPSETGSEIPVETTTQPEITTSESIEINFGEIETEVTTQPQKKSSGIDSVVIILVLLIILMIILMLLAILSVIRNNQKGGSNKKKSTYEDMDEDYEIKDTPRRHIDYTVGDEEITYEEESDVINLDDLYGEEEEPPVRKKRR